MVADNLEDEHARFEREKLSPGPMRDFKHDGVRLARFFFVAVVQVESGKVKSASHYFDMLTMLTQIGATGAVKTAA